MSIEEITFEAEERMEKSVTLLSEQLRGVRTGRAAAKHPAEVDADGNPRRMGRS